MLILVEKYVLNLRKTIMGLKSLCSFMDECVTCLGFYMSQLINKMKG
jgi:hypothetical protein